MSSPRRPLLALTSPGMLQPRVSEPPAVCSRHPSGRRGEVCQRDWEKTAMSGDSMSMIAFLALEQLGTLFDRITTLMKLRNSHFAYWFLTFRVMKKRKLHASFAQTGERPSYDMPVNCKMFPDSKTCVDLNSRDE